MAHFNCYFCSYFFSCLAFLLFPSRLFHCIQLPCTLKGLISTSEILFSFLLLSLHIAFAGFLHSFSSLRHLVLVTFFPLPASPSAIGRGISRWQEKRMKGHRVHPHWMQGPHANTKREKVNRKSGKGWHCNKINAHRWDS